jgi:hypothetical protein
MKAKSINRLSKEKLMELIKTKEFNLQMPYGYIYFVGGILSRLYYGQQQIYINDKWINV